MTKVDIEFSILWKYNVYFIGCLPYDSQNMDKLYESKHWVDNAPGFALPDTDVWVSLTGRAMQSAALGFLYLPDTHFRPVRLHSKCLCCAGWSLSRVHPALISDGSDEALRPGWYKSDSRYPWIRVAGDIAEVVLRWKEHCSALRCNESPIT